MRSRSDDGKVAYMVKFGFAFAVLGRKNTLGIQSRMMMNMSVSGEMMLQ